MTRTAETSFDEATLRRAQQMSEACQMAVARKGLNVLCGPGYSAQYLGSGELGVLTGHYSPAGRHVVIRDGLDPVTAAVVLAHETGHCWDPGLNHERMSDVYADSYDACEAVANYVAYVVTYAFGLMGCLDASWFAEMMADHVPLDEFVADDGLVHRADMGAFMILQYHSEARAALRRQRALEGRPFSGMTSWQKLKMRLSGKEPAELVR